MKERGKEKRAMEGAAEVVDNKRELQHRHQCVRKREARFCERKEKKNIIKAAWDPLPVGPPPAGRIRRWCFGI